MAEQTQTASTPGAAAQPAASAQPEKQTASSTAATQAGTMTASRSAAAGDASASEQQAKIAVTQAQFDALVARVNLLETALKAAQDNATGNASTLGTLRTGIESLGEIQLQQGKQIEVLESKIDAVSTLSECSLQHAQKIEALENAKPVKPLEDSALRTYLLKYGIG